MRISNIKKEKICDQILSVLYTFYPKPVFTFTIAQEIARDEEFVKKLLLDLKKKSLVLEIKKSPSGRGYLRRTRWKLDNRAYSFYKSKQK